MGKRQRRGHQEPLLPCSHVALLREFLVGNRMELWASRQEQDVSLNVACSPCRRNFVLSPNQQ